MSLSASITNLLNVFNLTLIVELIENKNKNCYKARFRK